MDRDEMLRRAEKLLRQGRLDAAIGEYVRVVEEWPADLASLNTLGDLYVRAAKSDLAVPLYMRVAEAFHREGFLSKAAGFYKKVLKYHPRDEQVLLRLAELSVSQRLLVEARTYFRAAASLREARGDRRGADEVVVRLGEIDGGDCDTRLLAARAQARLLGAEGAGALREAAAELARLGRDEEAHTVLREVAAIDPRDIDTVERVVRASIDAGRIDEARATLSRHGVIDSPRMLKLLVEIELAAGDRPVQAREAVEAWLAADPHDGPEVATLARRWADRDPDAAWVALAAAVDLAAASGDFAEAAGWIESFVAGRSYDVRALQRLVELCVDANAEPRLVAAQEALAEAYLHARRLAEARAVARDLVERYPGSPAHVERLARVDAAMRGPMVPVDQDDDKWSGEILSVVALLDEEETRSGVEEVPSIEASGEVGAPWLEDPILDDLDLDEAPGVQETQSWEVESPEDAAPGADLPLEGFPGGFPPGEAVGHLDALFGEGTVDALPRDAHPGVEIDLTPTLNELADGSGFGDLAAADPLEGPGAAEPEALGTTEPRSQADLDAIFARWRTQTLTKEEQSPARLLALGETYLAAGLAHEARPLLEAATRDAGCRFRAARLLARLHEQHGEVADAINWLERAIDVPDIDVTERFVTLRELGELLEAAGEAERALAIWLEAQSLVPGDKGVEERVARLSPADSPGGEPSTR